MTFPRLLLRIFFPERCIHCGGIIPLLHKCCYSCAMHECAVPDNFCFHCNSRQCHCTDSGRRLKHITAPFIYTDSVKEIIMLLKFRKRRHYAKLLSVAITQKVIEDFSDVSFDAVTFVPASKQTKKKRGYNQCEVLARHISEGLFVPCVDTLVKTKDTPHQHLLSASGRQKNLEDAITVRTDTQMKDKTFLICDDIKTTGSTLLICESLLLKAGAADVYCCVAAMPVYGNPSLSIDTKRKNI